MTALVVVAMICGLTAARAYASPFVAPVRVQLPAGGLKAGLRLKATVLPHITLSSPHAHQVFQRNAANRGAIRITGRASGVSGAIQVSWRGAPWTHLCHVASGRFTGWLHVQKGGQGTLRVRSADHHAIGTSVAYIGVGDIFVVAGQSNACGEGTVLSAYTYKPVAACLFGNDYRWHKLKDPTDSSADQVDLVSRDSTVGGSVWPLVANILAADHGGVPMAFVPCAKSTTAIADWQRSNVDPDGGATLYGSMVKRVHAIGGRVRAVLFWQGETDALKGTSRSTYTIASSRFDANVWRDLHVPTVVAQIGDYNDDPPRPAADDVRLAQEDLWLHGGPIVVPGPCLYDVDLHGSNHFLTAAQMAIAARRWAAAIEAGIYHRGDGRGPKLASATYDGDLNITLRFADGSLPLLPAATALGGFIVRQEGIPVAVSAAVVSGSDTVALTLAAPATGVLSVSLGSGKSAAGMVVPTDSSDYRLPAWPFVDYPVAVLPPG